MKITMLALLACVLTFTYSKHELLNSYATSGERDEKGVGIMNPPEAAKASITPAKYQSK